MRILVTGGAGFIGSNLIRLLLTEKAESVINLDKLSYAGNLESLTDIEEHPEYTFEQIDLCDSAALDNAFQKHKPHAVMHLAAESHVDRSIDGPGEFIQSNIVGTFNLLQASLQYWRSLEADCAKVETCVPRSVATTRPDAKRTGTSEKVRSESGDFHTLEPSHLPTKETFRFLHVSTDEVYGSLTPDASGFSETTRYDPHSPYSASKAASDHLARAWADTYGLPVLVTNCSNNYGPYQFPEKLIPVVILKCLRGEPIPIYGTGENIRDWLYVNDHAEALYTVVTTGRVGETYNIGGNNEQTNLNLVRSLCQLMDELVPATETRLPQIDSTKTQSFKNYSELITFVEDRPGHDLRYAIDASKIRDELGWQPKENFNSGFRKTVQWYLENSDWWQDILNKSHQLKRIGR